MTPQQLLDCITKLVNTLPQGSDVSPCLDGLLVMYPPNSSGFGEIKLIHLDDILV